MCLGVASEITRGARLALRLVVLIEGKRQLLVRRAHRVRAVNAGRGVRSDAAAGSGIEPTDGGEERCGLVTGESGVGLAGERGHHAGAELGVGDGWESGGGGPGGAGCGAGLGDGVGDDVG